MLKSVIIAPNSLPVPPVRGGGVQTVIAETVPHFKDFKPYVFSNCEYGIDKLPLKETVGNIEHRRICQSSWDELKIKLRSLTTLNYFPYVHEIIRQVKEIEPDIIHLMNRPWFLPILRKYLGKRTKIILHHFNNYLMEMRPKRAKKYLDLVDGFIGCSKFTVDAEVLSRFPYLNNKCFIVSNGVDTAKFDPEKIKPANLASLRKKYGIKDGDVVVLYVGRLARDKGAFELLSAVKELIVNVGASQLKLMIVGSSFYGGKTKITPFIKQLQDASKVIEKNIVFTGFIDRWEIQNIYGLAHIVAVPSIVLDASPTVCYEASSMKLPIVATKRGGIPELVLEGQTGLLIDDPYDTDALAEKILYFLKNPDQRSLFGERGRQYMVKNFTWEIVASKMEKAYKHTLKEA